MSNPASTRAVVNSTLTASKQRAGWWSIPRMITSTTMECLSLAILMQSAQLDQCAAPLDLTADVSPRPPVKSGKLAVTCASTGAPGDPRMAQRQCRTAASCRSANCRVWSGRIMRNQKFASMRTSRWSQHRGNPQLVRQLMCHVF